MTVALLCVDWQDVEKDELKRCGFSSEQVGILENNICTAIKTFSERGKQVVHVGGDPDFVPFKSGVGYYKDIPEENKQAIKEFDRLEFSLPMEPLSIVAYKGEYSVADEPSIVEWLKKNEISEICLCGVFESYSKFGASARCLTQTAIHLKAMKFVNNVTILEEGTECGIYGSTAYVSSERRSLFYKYSGVEVLPLKGVVSRLDAKPAEPIIPEISPSLRLAREVWRNKGCVPGER